MCSFLCRLSTRLPCMRVSVCVKLCGGVRTAPRACKQPSSGSWCMFVCSQGLSFRALGLFLAGRGCGVSGNAGDCTVPQLHLLNTGCSLEPSACLGACERGCVPNGEVDRGGQGSRGMRTALGHQEQRYEAARGRAGCWGDAWHKARSLHTTLVAWWLSYPQSHCRWGQGDLARAPGHVRPH